MDDFTNEDIKMLAEVERRMDSGEFPHVVNKGMRWAVPEETMRQLGLVSGQTASDFLIREILETNLANLRARIGREKSGIRYQTHQAGCAPELRRARP